MDVSPLSGPSPQRGVGVVAPFDFALDRELWRWFPDGVSLHVTRTPYVPVEVGLDLARLVSEHETLADAVRALSAVAPEAVAYACTSGSFVGGIMGERAMREAMSRAGAADALFLSCTNPPTYDVIPQLRAELRIPVISANQVTMWAVLRRLGTRRWDRIRR